MVSNNESYISKVNITLGYIVHVALMKYLVRGFIPMQFKVLHAEWDNTPFSLRRWTLSNPSLFDAAMLILWDET